MEFEPRALARPVMHAVMASGGGSTVRRSRSLTSSSLPPQLSAPRHVQLPLFYALSQSGRAIAAAHTEGTWRLRGHGLSSQELDVSLLDIYVKRTPAASKDGRSVDSVTAVASATGSAVFTDTATIGALWASLPEVSDLLRESFDAAPFPIGMALQPDPNSLHRRIDPGHVYTVAVNFAGTPDELDKDLSEHYPASVGLNAYRPFPGQPVHRAFTPQGSGLVVRWNRQVARDAGLDRDVAALEQDGWLWLCPSVSEVALSSLLTWWTLLFGLSMLARYEPAGWVQALDYESSPLAAPLAKLLDIGLTRVPELVLDALIAVPKAPEQTPDRIEALP